MKCSALIRIGVVWLVSSWVWAASQYWDISDAAGLQHGSGSWSLSNAYWSPSVAGTGPLSPWEQGNTALFSASGGISEITLSSVITAGVITVNGSIYSLILTNGGFLTSTGTVTIGSASGANDNQVVLAGTTGTVTWDAGRQNITLGNNTAGGVTNNRLVLTGPNAVLTNVSSFYLTGDGASFTMENGARFYGTTNFADFRFGYWGNNLRMRIAGGSIMDFGNNVGNRFLAGYGSTNNVIIVDGGIITNLGENGGNAVSGPGCALILTNQASFYITGTPVRSLTISQGARLDLDGSLMVMGGNLWVGHTSRVSVVGASELRTGAESKIGSGATSPRTEMVLRGGALWNAGNSGLSVGESSSHSNRLVIDGSVVTNAGRLLVGDTGGSWNEFWITNGGAFFQNATGTRTIGSSTSASNLVTIVGGEGVTSRWDVGTIALAIGAGGISNGVVVDGQGVPGSAVLTNVGALTVAGGASVGTLLDLRDGALLHSLGAITLAASSSSRASNNLIQIADTNTLWNAGFQTLTIGMAGATNNELRIMQRALVTNVGLMAIGGVSNRAWISTGGRLYTVGGTIGNAAAMNSNEVVVTGEGSKWNVGGGVLALGVSAAATGNVLTVHNGGTVENAILVAHTNNRVNFLGGRISIVRAGVTNGIVFEVGDGNQDASLILMNGVGQFWNGVLVQSNALVGGIGDIQGGPVVLTNGGLLSPGISGAGSLTVGGTKFDWAQGGVYRCEITNLNQGPGTGWDLVTVTSNLDLTSGGGNRWLVLDSRGSPPVGFDPSKNYSLKVMSFGSLSGDPYTTIALDTNAYQASGVWVLTNVNNALWLVYTGETPPGPADYSWNVPNSGNWSEGGNWQGASAPPAGGGPGLTLYFGDGATPYRATNNLTGNFHLNQLRFGSVSSVTNFLIGNPLALSNEGARVDYLAGANGAFIISNNVRLAADTEFGGDAFGGMLSFGGALTTTGRLTMKGDWLLHLNNTANSFDGPFLVDSRQGGVFLNHVSTFNGSGPVIISNGIIRTLNTTATMIFANQKPNRRLIIEGPSSVWTNECYWRAASFSSNVQIIVNGGRLYTRDLTWFNTASDNGLFVVSNGAYVTSGGNAAGLGTGSTNCELRITGEGSSMYFNQYFMAGNAGGVSNRVIIEKGGLIRGGNNFSLRCGGGASDRYNVVEIREGGRALPYGVVVNGVNSLMRFTGAGTFINSLGSYQSWVGTSTTAWENLLLVEEQAVVSNLYIWIAQNGACSNTMRVSSGARVFLQANDLHVARGSPAAVSNALEITGSNTLFNGAGRFFGVCYGTGFWNRLTVSDGALLTNVLTLVPAFGPEAVSNSIVVDGGFLYARNMLWSNDAPNEFVLTGNGQANLQYLLATTAGARVWLNGGALNVVTVQVDNGKSFCIGDGAQPARLVLQPRGYGRFANGLIVTNQGVLGGVGVVEAETTLFGTLNPGLGGVGALTNRGACVFQQGSDVVMELETTQGPGIGWDHLTVTNGALLLGGTLKPVLRNNFRPHPLQSFTVITATDSLAGSFQNSPSGGRVAAYDTDGETKVGSFRLTVSASSVILDDFSTRIPTWGTVIMVR